MAPSPTTITFIGAAALLGAARAMPAVDQPNFVWLHVESTDGRTYTDAMSGGERPLVPIPRIRSLKDRGALFVNHYANVPICCPSRASVITGRQPHNLPHTHNGIQANGAWSNYEGFGLKNTTFDKLKISDRLAAAGYTINIVGKEDWVSGGHSSTTMLDSFSVYSRWPYSIPEEGGFHIWGDCGGNTTVKPAVAGASVANHFKGQTAHANDWKTVAAHEAYFADATAHGAAAQQPFFVYGGMVIVHPPYNTDEEHLARIPMDKVTAPHWPAMEDLAAESHPCDLQVSMKKGCARTSAAAGLGYLNTTLHKTQVRAAYYAMIAEWDDMVGAYIDAVERAGLTERTVFVVSSDHGDMQMEHQQFFKMVAYEASTRVPVVVAGPGVNHVGDGNVHALTSLVDLMPTFLELAGAPAPRSAALVGHADPAAVDGYSLVPLLQRGDAAADSHPAHVVSQFHGENLAMSWYMVRRAEMKYVAWGTGEQHEPQLFNLTADPDEWHNLAKGVGLLHGPAAAPSAALRAAHPFGALAAELDALLRTDIDYPAVTMDVATYNVAMARWWMGVESNWRGVLEGGNAKHPQGRGNGALNADWGELWDERSDEYFKAWWLWLNSTDASGNPTIPKCPSVLEYGWSSSSSSGTD